MFCSRNRIGWYLSIILFLFLVCLFFHNSCFTSSASAQFLGALPFQGIFTPFMGRFSGTPAFSSGLPYQDPGFGFGAPGLYGYTPQIQGINWALPTPFAGNYSPFGYASQLEGNGFLPYSPLLNTGSMNPFAVGSVNPYASLYGIPFNSLSSLQGTYPQQMIPAGSFQGSSPYFSPNPWGQNQQWNSFNPWQIWDSRNNNTNNGSTDTGNSGDDNGGDTSNNSDITDVRGYWAGTWEAFQTDPNGLITDPNGEALIAQTGEIKLHITQQILTGGTISGTVEITDWDVGTHPNWDGESEEIDLTGWIDKFNQYFKARYIYKEEDYEYHYILVLGSNLNLTITNNRISGSFTISGQDYYIIGSFTMASFQPE